MSKNRIRSAAGFSLVEAVVAIGLVATTLVMFGHMCALSVANNISARAGTYAQILAEQKIEQLRSLAWGLGTDGYDYLDETGRAIGNGTLTPPIGTAYARRWSIEPLAANPDNALVIVVVVTRHVSADGRARSIVRLGDDARLITVRAR